jgi:hypothetical protein
MTYSESARLRTCSPGPVRTIHLRGMAVSLRSAPAIDPVIDATVSVSVSEASLIARATES